MYVYMTQQQLNIKLSAPYSRERSSGDKEARHKTPKAWIKMHRPCLIGWARPPSGWTKSRRL